MIPPLWKMVWRFLKKLGIKLLHGPAIPLLGIYTKKTTTQDGTCTSVFMYYYNSQDMEAA